MNFIVLINMTMISTEKKNFLKILSKGIYVTMELNKRAIRIVEEPMNKIEAYISDNFIQRLCCYYTWFSYELFNEALDTMDDKHLCEILLYFDHTNMTIAEIYKNSFIKIEELDDEEETQFAKDIENKVITSFEQFLNQT